MFINKNLNPKGHNTSDCTVRALAAAAGITWDKAFIEIANEAFKMKVGPSDIKVFENLILRYGFKAVSCKAEKGKPRPKVKDIASLYRGHIAVARVAHHVVTCADGNYIDTWDCGEAAVYKVWIKEK